MSNSSEHIAIIGLSCRFPQAGNPEQFWQLLHDGIEAVTFFSDQALIATGVDPEHLAHPDYVKASAILDGIELFDADFFNMPPREAEITDPQHRIFLECAAEALEMSGYNPECYHGKIGVYAGCGMSSYLIHNIIANPEVCLTASHFQLLMGNNKDFMPTRASYKLNLKGPSINISTACSTSLVAIHTACQNLLDYQCDMALAGGVSIQVPQQQGYFYEPAGISSPDGHCRAFDAKAQGTVSGNGAGIVVLKRLEDALADGDTIHAVICGSAVNNDGSDKVGYTAPSVSGQAEVIAEAQAVANIHPETIGYIEAHGTGTALGDPIEIAALTQAFRHHSQKNGYCAIGSVKTNFGHLDEAAGVAGLIKTVLALKHRQIPASLHFEQPNPEINFKNSPFFVNNRLCDWRSDGTNPLRAGVSSFGIGGTNAHLIVEEAPVQLPTGTSRTHQLLVLSAKTASALNAATANLIDYLKKHPDAPLADVAYTLKVGRKAFDYKCFIVCQSVADAIDRLQASLEQDNSIAPKALTQNCVFMFPGQGSQYPDMGRDLYQQEPVFRQYFDQCAKLLLPLIDVDLRRLCYAGSDAQQLTQTAIAQPLLFSFEYALAQLWLSFGIKPQALIGHSIGEYVAACLADVISLSDALTLVAARGRLMQQLPAGAMLAVSLSADETATLLNAGLAIAAINEPQRTVVAGTLDAIASLRQTLAQPQIHCQKLQTSHAFHSGMMDPVLDEFTACVGQIKLNPPQIPYISNVTGTWITDAQATDPAYYAGHLRHTVRFADGIETLLEGQQQIFLEVGPGRTLSDCVSRHPAKTGSHTIVSSIRHPHDSQSDQVFLLKSLGQLWQIGVDLHDWAGFYAHERRYRLPLPTYPFERKRYWVEPNKTTAAVNRPNTAFATHESLAVDVDSWFYRPVWRAAPAVNAAMVTNPLIWLVLVDTQQYLEPLVHALREIGQTVITVAIGDYYNAPNNAPTADGFTLHPQSSGDYAALFNTLEQQNRLPHRIVHGWSLTLPATEITKHTTTGLYSLFLLTQAWTQVCVEPAATMTVFTNNMQAITGDDVLCPEQACVLGAVRVIPTEFPGLQCHSIDLDFSTGLGSGLIPQLLAELCTAHNEAIVAYRHNERFIQTFEPVSLNPEKNPLKENGVYLITGGFGSMGLAFADYIARRVKAKLVLVGRNAPTSATTRFPLPAADFTPAECAFAAELENELRRELNIKTLDDYEGLRDSLNKLCAQLIYHYFATAANISAGRLYDPKGLQNALGIQPSFARFYQFSLKTLADCSLLRHEDGLIRFTAAEPATSHEQLQSEFSERYPGFKGLAATLTHCATHYAAALRGDIPAISVLYPEGTPEFLDNNSAATVEFGTDRIYLKLLAELLTPIAKARPQDRPLKILEVGGGTGGLTHYLLTALQDCAIEYHFTDIGHAFLRKARTEALQQGFTQVSFSRFDIAEDALNQGLKAADYEVIVGYNVVHATPRIQNSTANLLNLLAPGGLLCLVETVRQQNWDDMIWGLAEGWWYFEDEELRTHTPILTLDQWENVLRKHAGVSVASFPLQPELRQRTDAGLIIVRRHGDSVGNTALSWLTSSNAEQENKLAAIEALGSEVLCLRADVADPAQMQTVVNETCARFGRIDGVIHTAGVLGQGLIRNKTAAEIDRVLAPKVAGSQILAALVNQYKPDFFLLCSSMSSVAPIKGQSDYCAANAFLDAFAAYNSHHSGVRTIAVDWGVWQELGMIEQAHISTAAKQIIRDEIRTKGWFNIGIAILERILASPGCPPQVIVSPENLRTVEHKHALSYPLFAHFTKDSATQTSYIGYYNEQDYWLFDEHRLENKAVLPGTGYLELARAAFVHCSALPQDAVIELSEVYFLTPLMLESAERREVRTILQQRGADVYDFFIVSKLGENRWLQHARGTICHAAAQAAPRHDLQAIAARCKQQEIITTYRTCNAGQLTEFEERLKTYGPRWINLAWAKFGANQALACLELAPAYVGDTEVYKLHPALLDIATGFLYIKQEQQEYGCLPFCYRRITLYGALPPRIYSHVIAKQDSGDGMLSYDVIVTDEYGAEQVNISHYALKPVAVESATYKQLYDSAGAEARRSDSTAEPDNFCLEITNPGVLDSLVFRPSLRRAPNADEVEIEIAYVGLNFIEVLTALGLLERRAEIDFQQFGLECVGTIVRVGAQVTALKPGDEVLAFCHAALSRYSTTPAYTVAPKPVHLTSEQAATMPVAYATAYYALISKGRLRKGERVLIHAASGGVGMAAINIARWVGAEIYATAGTPEKRAYLQNLGVKQVMDSRTLAFAGEIMAATAGQGVDVVLNSLGGEFISKSLEVLARYGRFLELGKRDFMQNTALGLQPFAKSLSFFALDVGTDLPDFAELWQELNGHFQQGHFPPLPHRTFAVSAIAQGFEFMAQAKHIGKVLISLQDCQGFPQLTTVGSSGAGVPLSAILGDVESHNQPDANQQTDALTALTGIWRELLGIENIAPDADFFALNGDSLLAAQVISRVHKYFRIALPMSAIFDAPTLQGLAVLIEQKLDNSASNSDGVNEYEEEGEL